MKTQDIYKTVTDKIIESLTKGNIPWRKTWEGGSFGANVNLVSRKPYRGINQLMTSCFAIDKGFKSNNWLTYKQAQDLNGNVKKGEKSCPIVYFTKLEIENDKPKNDDDKIKEIPFLKLSYVFNLDQIEGLDSLKSIEKKPENKPFNKIEACESLINGFFKSDQSITLKHEGNRACYSPQRDLILIPEREAFKKEEDYYAVLFHELTHATGSEKRLARIGVCEFDRFGSHQYSKEELIAEIGAAFLSSVCKIDSAELTENSAAYIQSWLKVLKTNEPRFIFEAAAAAQKASDLILNVNAKTEKKVG